MPEKKYIVTLTAEEREQLHELVSKGKAAAYKQRHARVLLKADEGPHGEQWTDAEISRALDVHSSTIERLRQRFVEESLEACLQRKEQKNRKAKKFDGAAEARLTAVACSDRRRAESAGPSNCWPMKWWPWRLSIVSAAKRFARR